MFDVDELAWWLSGHPDIGIESAEELLLRVGRNQAPRLLDAMLGTGVDTTVITALVGPTWSMAEFPFASLDEDRWLELFLTAGFTVDGQRSDRPRGPLGLYPGCPAGRRFNWSWTSNIDVARRYASGRWYFRDPGIVWRLDVDPSRLLACNTSRGEDEYIIDTAGLGEAEVVRCE